MQGSKDRQLARFLHLVPLLLEGGRSRDALIAALRDALVRDGLADALPAGPDGEDPTSMFDRDWRSLRQLGLLEKGGGRGQPARPGPRLPLWATPAEAHALDAAHHALMQLGVPEAEALRALRRRVRPTSRGDATWSLPPSLREIRSDVWAALTDAIERGRRVRITYRYPDRPEPEVRELDRARIVWLTGAFYVCAVRLDLTAGNPPTFEAVREYRLDRILAIDVLDTAVASDVLPPLRVVFRLASALAGRIHDMVDGEGNVVQQVAVTPTGELRVVIHEVSELRARQRLLAFGAQLLGVEEPESLREALAADLEVMRAALAHPAPTTRADRARG